MRGECAIDPMSGDWNIHCLHQACVQGDWTEFIFFLNETTVNAPNNPFTQKTPLHHVCEKGHIDLALKLIEEGALINAQDANGHTPLDLTKKAELISLLLQKGADPTIRPRRGKSLYEREGDQNNTQMLDIFYKHLPIFV